jgi:hypothetical protein
MDRIEDEMKFTLEIELGNDAMQTANDVFYAFRHSFHMTPMEEVLTTDNTGVVMDTNGNKVGKWNVLD